MPALKKLLLKIFFTIFFNIAAFHMQAQPINGPEGEYYLQGVMETAAGFKLDPDSSFEFFYSYGALDRSGSGKWSQNGQRVIFNSTPAKGPHFSLLKSSHANDEFITIKIVDPNPVFLYAVYASIGTANSHTDFINNQKGIIRFLKQAADSILLLFEFTPEKTASFSIKNSTDNYFEFGFEPWLMEVFFTGLVLEITENGLKGPLPLLKEGEYLFRKK